MHTPRVELTAVEVSASGSAVLVFVTSISTATTCLPLSTVVSSEEAMTSTGSFSFFLFWIRFFFASRDENYKCHQCYSHTVTSELYLQPCYPWPQRHVTDVQIWVWHYSANLLVHICVVAPLLVAAVWSCHSEPVAGNRNIQWNSTKCVCNSALCLHEASSVKHCKSL